MEPEAYFDLMFWTMVVVIIVGLVIMISGAVVVVTKRGVELIKHIRTLRRKER